MGSITNAADMAKLSDRLFIAAVVPLKADESIDEEGYRKLIRYFVAALDRQPDLGVIANPEAGDIFYMSPEEQLRIIQLTLEEVGGRMPVFSGATANSTQNMAKVARAAADAGVDGLFLAPPVGAMDITVGWDPVNYPEVWMDTIDAVTKAVPDKPIICHPSGAVTTTYGIGLPEGPTIKILKRFPQIVGWKMTYAYGGNRKVSRQIHKLDRYVALLPAMALYMHEHLATGDFDGALSGSFNFAMEPMLAHINAWRKNDVVKAREIWNGGLAELQEYIYEELGRVHARYKAATWLRGLIDSPFLRAPMPRPRKEEVQMLYSLLSNLKLSVIPKPKVDKLVAQLAL